MWNSTMLAPLFLVSGISTGAAFMMLFPLGKAEHHFVQRWDLVAIGLEVVLLGLFLLSLFAGGGDLGREAVQRFVGGSLTGPFFALVVFGGLVVPFVIELLERRRHLRATALAPALVLVGGLSLRWLVVVAGQA
jgi:formate-dependent nitrite reductase membrane component NrfD